MSRQWTRDARHDIDITCHTHALANLAVVSGRDAADHYGNRDGRAAKHTPKLLTNSSGIRSRVLLGCQDLEYLYLSGAFIFIMLIITQILTRRSLNRMIIRNESSQQSNIDHGFTRTCE